MMSDWIEPGSAMRLTSGPLTLEVREHADGVVSVTLTTDAPAVLRQPAVYPVDNGRIVVDLEAVHAVGVRA